MKTELSTQSQVAILITLLLAIAGTRYNHFFTQNLLPDATWAAMFIAGLILSLRFALPALVLAVVSIDLGSTLFGASDVSGCLTLAYPFLLVSYASLWMMGRMSQAYWSFNVKGIAITASILTLAVGVAFVISNASWYVWAPEANVLSPWDYTKAVGHYAFNFWQSAFVWSGFALAIAYAVSMIKTTSSQSLRSS